ncbi:uncharacterized protein LOC113337953 [Papaver somniferum]|uniref:uncharacterized protein LOC113337953 n=1 Tax=Papaver somniferum TaxID=3469 RepID=UPI000E703804|nr:uncharacterized protein LOC113337953 [Papaver somniferum]
MKELQFKCLKSHDYHMLMQGLMPIFLMYCFKDHKLLREAIRQLSLFFKVLCSKVIDREALRLMHERVVESLCVFEMYFPPAFFVTMTHLVVHLAEEALTLGPVQFRWMYPFERMMRTYKVYGRNKNYIEGSITAQYEVDEGARHWMETS